MLKLRTAAHRWPLAEPFVISRGAILDAPVITVHLSDQHGHSGRGEGYGVTYHGETVATMLTDIAKVRAQIEQGIDRAQLLSLLPAGGARCALDAALWDLEAKRDGVDPFLIAGVAAGPVTSVNTISIRTLAEYEATARRMSSYSCLKIKVDGSDPVAAIGAVRIGAPTARLIVDTNQAWDVGALKYYAAPLYDLGVVLLEQPIPVGSEHMLDGYSCPIALCADELIDTEADLIKAVGRFSVINIKLDKTGGLTAALRLADAALSLGFRLMVGNMGGTSLSMAPGMVLAQRCDFVDLDGPLMLQSDCVPGFEFRNGVVDRPHLPRLWG